MACDDKNSCACRGDLKRCICVARAGRAGAASTRGRGVTRPVPAWRAERPWIDGHPVCDGLLPWAKGFLPPEASLAAQLRRFRDAGFDHVSLSAAAGTDTAPDAVARLGMLRREIAGADWIDVAEGPDAVREATRAQRFTVSFHFQSATPYAGDLDLAEGFAAAGVRRAILAHNEANVFADGWHEPRDAGLTAARRRLVARMDKAGFWWTCRIAGRARPSRRWRRPSRILALKRPRALRPRAQHHR